MGVTTRKMTRMWLLGLVAGVLTLFGGCSSDGAAPAVSPIDPVDDTPTAGSSATTSETGANDEADTPRDPEPVAEATPTPSLADNDVATITVSEPGSQVQDAQGNLVAVYGMMPWPDALEGMANDARAQVAFFGRMAVLNDPATSIVAIDVGLCEAGIDADAVGTAEFFVQRTVDDPLSTAVERNRELVLNHPVQQPGFSFPRSAECTRGWMPMIWSEAELPTVARYVLAVRPDGQGPVERHVYQWELDLPAGNVAALAETSEQFAAGQTVTFNQGDLAGSTVTVDGWAELVGAGSVIDGTRQVAVKIDFCPESERLPQFGLGIDGWNMIAPSPSDSLLGARDAADPTAACFDGWLEFSVPFGAEPTSFFVSDGKRSDIGYAEWSLRQAALPIPQ